MTSIPILVLLAFAVVATSFLSGVFGMAGGMILIGILLVLLDVAPAMVLFGVTQTASNGWRALLWRQHVVWGIMWHYVAGTLVALAVMRFVALIPDKAVVFLCLGLVPFAVELLPRRLTPDITRPGAPFVCGMIMAVLQVLAGAVGGLLDVFFQKSALDRKAIVATKAMGQTFSHVMRIAYFGSFVEAFAAPVPWWVYAGAVACAMVGTSLAAQILNRMSDADFRRWSYLLINAVSLAFLGRGLWLLAAG